MGFRTHGVIGDGCAGEGPAGDHWSGSGRTQRCKPLPPRRRFRSTASCRRSRFPPEQERRPSSAWYNHVSPEFFSLLEIPILEGRNFTADEARSGAPVAIVSQLTARRLWPKGDAVGREIFIRHDDARIGETHCRNIRPREWSA